MEDLKALLLAKLKTLKGVDDDKQDTVYLFAIELAVETLLAFCNLDVDEWPVGLNATAVLMAMDSLSSISLSVQGDTGDGDITGMTEGDFKIERESRATTLSKLASLDKSLPDKYKRIAYRYRKLAD